MPSQPTIRDVAKKAGVGIGTVSRVLNNSPKVTPATRQAVLEAISALGFRPNSVARALPRKSRIHNLGVITQPFTSFYPFAQRLRGVQFALRELDAEYEVVLYNVSSLPHYEERLRTIVRTGAVDGLIIIDLDLFDEQKQMLRDANLPFVGINHFQDRDWPCVGTNNYEGGYLATRHLIDLGHRDIAYLGDLFVDLYEFNTSYERYSGFQRAMREHNLSVPEEYVRLGFHDYQIAKEQAADLFALPKPPTAVFVMSDNQAFGCLAAAREAGLRVPQDVSIIGYDDLEISLHVNLTTVHQHLELSGRMALEYLLQVLKGEDAVVPSLPPLEITRRGTTGPVSPGRKKR
ncbi:MAG: LacI family DNA-binding transcriptional regulator [Anaerolineae bacterium]|nr:LacI family DNA-binding transcriptional regulator [Anaerolineae bacterium]